METSLAFFPERKKFNINWIINTLSRFHVSIALLDNVFRCQPENICLT